MPTAFITGCATGFGHRLAKRLVQEGWHVIATDPTTSGLQSALGGPSERLLVLELDVRVQEQVVAATAAANAWNAPDVLVNNAGFAVFGTVEETNLDAVQDMFNVNVIGLGRITQQLLPTLRARRGMVVNLSSVAGIVVFPESGWYAASKHAVEAISSALWQECADNGIRVRAIRPGSFATQFSKRAAASSQERTSEGPYSEQYVEWDAQKTAALELPQDPNLVVEAIFASLSDPAPFMQIPVGLDAIRLLAAIDHRAPNAWATNESTDS